MNSNPTDKEIVHRVLRGDVGAFSHIVREYSPRMMNLALGIAGGSGGSGGRDTAEDIVQDALVKAYEKLGTWRGESSLSTWLYRITYTTAVSSLRGERGERGEKGRKVHWSDNGEAANLSTESEEGDWQATEDNIARMRHAIDLLTPLDRTLVNLFYLEERSVRETAEICGQSEANVKTRLHRARTQLRKLMEN